MRHIRWTAVSIYKNKNCLMYLGCKYPTCHGVIQWNVFHLFFDSLYPLPSQPLCSQSTQCTLYCLILNTFVYLQVCAGIFCYCCCFCFFYPHSTTATWEQNLEWQYIFGKGKWIKEKMNDYMNEWINECC